MAASDADLMGIGEHCAVADCNQLDFLPFKCDCCGRTFCLQHRQYAAHSCSAAAGRELEVIACPLCAQGIRLRPGEDANLAFERHAGGECNPANYQKVHNKPRCPAAGCREKLTSINTYACKECGRKVCLKHRLTEDHQCPGKAAARSFWGGQPTTSGRPGGASAAAPLHNIGTYVAKLTGGAAAAAAPAASSKAPAAKPAAAAPRRGTAAAAVDPANTLRGSAQRRMQQAGSAGTGPEVCPHCGARFADPVALVEHNERAHAGGRDSSSCQVS